MSKMRKALSRIEIDEFPQPLTGKVLTLITELHTPHDHTAVIYFAIIMPGIQSAPTTGKRIFKLWTCTTEDPARCRIVFKIVFHHNTVLLYGHVHDRIKKRRILFILRSVILYQSIIRKKGD